jgi:hypothetical protein
MCEGCRFPMERRVCGRRQRRPPRTTCERAGPASLTPAPPRRSGRRRGIDPRSRRSSRAGVRRCRAFAFAICVDAGVSRLSQLRVRTAPGFDADASKTGQQDTPLKSWCPGSSPGLAIARNAGSVLDFAVCGVSRARSGRAWMGDDRPNGRPVEEGTRVPSPRPRRLHAVARPLRLTSSARRCWPLRRPARAARRCASSLSIRSDMSWRGVPCRAWSFTDAPIRIRKGS